ncbi:MAG: cytochrome C oxidase subunit IV family protein [Chloroflexi bacterium]|nr:cytochrome C oxidase subunit IV family protein [Chloroflexota bacterium]
MDQEFKKSPPYFKGFAVLVILGILTGIEYYFGTKESPSVIFLAVLALIKAAFIVNYYMNISRLWSTEDHH